MKPLLWTFWMACAQDQATNEAVVNDLGSTGGAVGNVIRFDVYPSGADALMAQTWIADRSASLDEVQIFLNPTVEITGTIVGYQANPLHAEVPGADQQPVAATVRLARPGTITGSTTQTLEDGAFSLRVPAAQGYTFSVVPEDGSRLPFMVELGVNVSQGEDFGIIDLGYGTPVYGRISTSDGAPVEGLVVQLTEAQSNVEGPETRTDATGHYLLRADPGQYVLRSQGAAGAVVPTLETAVEVEDGGVDVALDLGNIERTLVSGQVLSGRTGAALKDVAIRIESTNLQGTDGSLVIETDTDGDGLFGRQLLAGRWAATFIPPFDSAYGGLVEEFEVGVDGAVLELEPLELPERVVLEGVVVDATGTPVPQAAVNAQEEGFDGYIFSTLTDDDGGFAIEVTPVPLEVTVSPPTADHAVTKRSIDGADGFITLQLEEGDLLAGTIESASGPTAFALVEVRAASGDLLATTLTDDRGAFSVRVGAP